MAEAMSNLVGFNGDVVDMPPRSPPRMRSPRCRCKRDAIELRFSGRGDGESTIVLLLLEVVDATSLLLFTGAIRTPPCEMPRVPCIAYCSLGGIVGAVLLPGCQRFSYTRRCKSRLESIRDNYDVDDVVPPPVPDYDHFTFVRRRVEPHCQGPWHVLLVHQEAMVRPTLIQEDHHRLHS